MRRDIHTLRACLIDLVQFEASLEVQGGCCLTGRTRQHATPLVLARVGRQPASGMLPGMSHCSAFARLALGFSVCLFAASCSTSRVQAQGAATTRADIPVSPA